MLLLEPDALVDTSHYSVHPIDIGSLVEKVKDLMLSYLVAALIDTAGWSWAVASTAV